MVWSMCKSMVKKQLCTLPHAQHCLADEFGGETHVLVVSKECKCVQVFLLLQDIVEDEEERVCLFGGWVSIAVIRTMKKAQASALSAFLTSDKQPTFLFCRHMCQSFPERWEKMSAMTMYTRSATVVPSSWNSLYFFLIYCHCKHLKLAYKHFTLACINK